MPLSAGYEDAAEAKKTLRAITAGQACVQLVLLAWQASPVLFLGLEPHPAAYILPPLGICCVSAGSLGISKPGSQGKLMLLLFQHLSGVLAGASAVISCVGALPGSANQLAAMFVLTPS